MKKFCLFITNFFCPALVLYADEQFVQEKLDKVLKELDKQQSSNWEMPDFLTNFFQFLGELGLLYRILFYLFVAALLAFIVYKIVSLFIKDSSFSFRKKTEESLDVQNSSIVHDSFLLKAQELSKSGDYSMALVQLHNGSCEYLFYKNLLQKGRDYTNREIFRKLDNSESLFPFKEIALEAELFEFNGHKIEQERYKELEKMYREAFYVQK
ncbi:MAG: hypothetical protein PQJ46_11945 [Spirochaetales bacterium]|nr:hypothetical protein [Spirochaetales bacterium]